MWHRGWRDEAWAQLDGTWDLIVVGGGISGAGILREAARAGLRGLLLEGGDFASGTSSRSSKLVHGGLRYLANAQVKLTMESVSERERLLREGRGLVSPLGFLMPSFRGDRTPGWVFGVGLILYDLLALRWGHAHYDARGLLELCPVLAEQGLLGGYRYIDATTDDARLTVRVLREAIRGGSLALNYARAESLLTRRTGQVCGVVVRDQAPGTSGRTTEVKAPVVLSATGAWADDLRVQLGGPRRLRRLRGSHLIFPSLRLPLNRAVSVLHPTTGRPVFAVPWEGVTLIGTTDVDHTEDLALEPAIDSAEASFLLAMATFAFPSLELSMKDVLATQAGVRAVVNTGRSDPSKESREYVLWDERGLLTVTGGKLTTFRRMAHTALHAAQPRLARPVKLDVHLPVLDPLPPEHCLEGQVDPALCLRLLGRHGEETPLLVEAAQPGEFQPIEGTLFTWAELRWAAREEGVVHLDDLMLRRLRLGLTLPEGGLALLDRVRAIVQPELGWDDERWTQEVERYRELWHRGYAPPAS
jgi:glycerol-3-phosphate dehydrogenase